MNAPLQPAPTGLSVKAWGIAPGIAHNNDECPERQRREGFLSANTVTSLVAR